MLLYTYIQMYISIVIMYYILDVISYDGLPMKHSTLMRQAQLVCVVDSDFIDWKTLSSNVTLTNDLDNFINNIIL